MMSSLVIELRIHTTISHTICTGVCFIRESKPTRRASIADASQGYRRVEDFDHCIHRKLCILGLVPDGTG